MEGKVLAGRFLLLKLLGQGGMGSVWLARHLELDIDVAVKLMDPSLTTNSEGLARFRREAQAAAALKSPHVVQVFDYGIDGDTPYIAMELLLGESLAKRLERQRCLPISAATPILVQVAKAVGKAHDAGIVHRDLKPENIFLVADDDESEIAKVLDFGIAKRTGSGGFATGAVQTQTGAMLGTPYYMSPEQASGRKDIDYRTDIWSFGVIACECLTGRRVFEVDSLGGLVLAICTEPIPPPSQLGPVPLGFDEWFARCVSRERDARFHTIREAAAALDAISRAATNGTPAPSRSAIISAFGTFSAPGRPNSALRGSGSLTGTQAGPTSITLSHLGNSGRSRRLWLVAIVGVLVGGGALFLWSTQSPHVSTVSALSTHPTLVSSASAPQHVAAALASTPSVSPLPSVTASAVQPTVSTVDATPSSTEAKQLQSKSQSRANKNRSRTAASTNSGAATPRPQPPANPTPSDNSVDLAF